MSTGEESAVCTRNTASEIATPNHFALAPDSIDWTLYRQMISREQQCPVCGGPNQCRVANGQAYKGPCWCESFTVPAEVQRLLAATYPDRACLCGECLVHFAESIASPGSVASPELTLVEGKDYYRDEFDRMVFTAAYHLKRGHCCDSGCRHCPYPPGRSERPSAQP